jgi:general secretion pathway protein D
MNGKTALATLLVWSMTLNAVAQVGRPLPASRGLPPPGVGVPGGFPAPGLGNGGSFGGGPNPAASTAPLVSAKTKIPFSKAQPEDINDENYPDLIESFDYSNAEIGDVIEAISKLTGKNFIVDPSVRGKITILAPSQITVSEAYRAFLSALAINGFTVVPYGNFLKVMSTRNAQRSSIETYSGNYFPDTDQLITRIVRLKYISADEVNKNLRILNSKDGEMVPYPPTNSLIITDFGSNIDRVMKIISQLDVPGFEEQLAVIRIHYARSKDIADLITKIINKGDSSQLNRFAPGIPRFRQPGEGGTGTAENYSLVVGDDRTNSIIVVGNKAGIDKIRNLVAQLDFRLRPEDRGGVYVYHVRHTEAEKLATTLNGIATESKKANDQATPGAPGAAPALPRPGQEVGQGSAQAVFGNDVKFTADKVTNSLLVTASRQDWETIKIILAKIDIPRDQVYVKAVIMEMGVTDAVNWGVNYYKFQADTNGIGRAGFSSGNLQSIIDPSQDKGGVLGFGGGGTVNVNIPSLAGVATGTTSTTSPAGTIAIPSLVGLVKFLKENTQSNVLSTPEIMALNNEEASIEVGEKVPVARNNVSNGTQVSNNIEREDVTVKLELTPYISPDTDQVQLKITQTANDVSNRTIKATELAAASIATTTRKIKTQILVNSGDTAYMGGLMKDADDDDISKIPILGDIPVIGWLFKARNKTRQKLNLMVFLTPTIIRNLEDNAHVVNKKINDRIDYIQKSNGGYDPYGDAVDGLPRKAVGADKSPDQDSGPRDSGSQETAPKELQESPETETF